MTTKGSIVGRRRRALWAEWIALYLVAPLTVFALFDGVHPLAALWPTAALALALLAGTPRFRWRALLAGPVAREWRNITAFAFAVGAGSAASAEALAPGAMLELPLEATRLWLTLLLIYPLASAWPQEVVFRTLFFERYGALFSNRRAAIAANGAVFGLAHALYGSIFVVASSALFGAALAYAYTRRRSTMLVWTLHGLAGLIAFTLGLGRWFLHGGLG